jgi:DNA (cytosine-5)-methyltransferase 1
MNSLVLSLFPGIGLLDMAFEEAGFCVVRGPDLLWGGDIKRFHPPAGVFDGVIGGPPCQAFSQLVHIVRHRYGESAVASNLIPEFERCVQEAQPAWFLMENVPAAPEPMIAEYAVRVLILNNRWVGGEQERTRRFSFGVHGNPIDLRRYLEVELFEPICWAPAVLASGGNNIKLDRNGRSKPRHARLRELGYRSRLTVSEGLRLQGLPADFFKHSPLTVEGQQRVIGNGVPLPMGRAIAKAVKEALERIAQ